MNIKHVSTFPTDKVRLCKSDVCIEARGDNAKLLTLAATFALLCIGYAVLTK